MLTYYCTRQWGVLLKSYFEKMAKENLLFELKYIV